MSEFAVVEAAIRVALTAHAGQVDKGGQPYILHPLRVMLACKTPTEQAVAALHDVVEDSGLSLASIETLFGGEIAEAVDALTRREGEIYAHFIERCAANPLARTVKLADLADNMDLGRLGRDPTIDDARRQIRYGDARNVLQWAAFHAQAGVTRTGRDAEGGSVGEADSTRSSEAGCAQNSPKESPQ